MKATKEVLAELKAKGFQFVQYPGQELYIAYSERRLFHTGCGISETSIEWLKEMFDGPPQEKPEGSSISNQEAQVRIMRLELAIQELLKPGKLDELFPLLPLTKAGKFHKTAATNLYIPGIKYTVNEDYFSQSEVALQIAAYGRSTYHPFQWEVYPEIGILRINPGASFVGRKTPPNLIDEKGNIMAPAAPLKKNKYLKQEELVPGTGYLDPKGTEYMYLGRLRRHRVEDSIDWNGNPCHFDVVMSLTDPLYLRMTPKAKKEIAACATLQEYLQKRFDAAEDEHLFTGLNETISKKFVEKGTVYFDADHNKIQGIHVEKDIVWLPQGTVKFDIDLP